MPTEHESIPEDVTIASTEIDLSEIPPSPPPPVDDELPIYIVYDEPPQIIGGMAELQKYIKYPRLAWESQIEGTVIVRILVGVSGKAETLKIIKVKPEELGFEESALEALKKVKWQPAKQRDRNIRV